MSSLAELDWQPVDKKEYSALPPAEKLQRIRHSTAHVMATALEETFPGIQLAIGPATEHGFFYDVLNDEPLVTDDLERIEEAMQRVAKEQQAFEVAEIAKDDAIAYFRDRGQDYKLDILGRIDDQRVTLYRNGPFVDLCAGPHAPHTGYCRFAKLLNISSAQWGGNAERPALTRISGTAWPDGKALKGYLRFLEEVKARDHRVIGPQFDLFSFHPWAASALWHPKGLVVRNELMALWRETVDAADYVEILNPLLYRKELFETSGHWEHFQEDMFIFRDDEGEPSFVLKPMNCPDTMLYFRSQKRSYRDLPMRVSEGQVLHRNEASGTIHGIMRTRNFQQDDAHIFLTSEQIQDEIASLLEMLDRSYSVFGLDYRIVLSTRPESFLGEIEVWDRAEASLQKALEDAGRDFTVEAGEGSFYGPKIDVTIRDSLGREWQCGTIQLDFQLPERFDLQYAAADGSLQRPIVIHRALFGSFERFLGVIIEHFAGAFPTWLAPVQAVVLPISESFAKYAETVRQRLKAAGIRVELVEDNSLNYRIRAAEKQKIPYMLIAGEREEQAGTVSVRRHKVKHQRTLGVDEIVAELEAAIAERALDVEVSRLASEPAETVGVGTEEAVY